MGKHSEQYILAAADELITWPRRKLDYCAPEELSNAFLDCIYAVGSRIGLSRINYYRAGVQVALVILVLFFRILLFLFIYFDWPDGTV